MCVFQWKYFLGWKFKFVQMFVCLKVTFLSFWERFLTVNQVIRELLKFYLIKATNLKISYFFRSMSKKSSIKVRISFEYCEISSFLEYKASIMRQINYFRDTLPSIKTKLTFIKVKSFLYLSNILRRQLFHEFIF